MSPILRDLGEREITRTILPKYTQGIGDDCAAISTNGDSIVATTDPVPEPAAKLIGGDPDLYWVGWLLVTINASDLAAAGATPLGFLSALECPSDTDVSAFERLLEGIRDSCVNEGMPYIGGNLREGNKLTGVGTAIGITRGRKPLTRSGARAGDVLVSIGHGGHFWRDALLVSEKKESVEKRVSPLYSPRSQIQAMAALRQGGYVNAAIDNSDGLLPTLTQLAEVNRCRILLFADQLTVPGADRVGVSPSRLWLGWGDWNVIASIPNDKVEAAKQLASEHEFVLTTIGSIECGAPEVFIVRPEKRLAAPRLESERFAKDSWFTVGLHRYIELLKEVDVG